LNFTDFERNHVCAQLPYGRVRAVGDAYATEVRAQFARELGDVHSHAVNS
jgi:hypothetical protein